MLYIFALIKKSGITNIFRVNFRSALLQQKHEEMQKNFELATKHSVTRVGVQRTFTTRYGGCAWPRCSASTASLRELLAPQHRPLLPLLPTSAAVPDKRHENAGWVSNTNFKRRPREAYRKLRMAGIRQHQHRKPWTSWFILPAFACFLYKILYKEQNQVPNRLNDHVTGQGMLYALGVDGTSSHDVTSI